MKKIITLRSAAAVAVLTLLTTCLIGGTFAKYTTKAGSSDGARTAYWGFQSTNTLDLTGLFTNEYGDVESADEADVIAPGTEGSATFSFAYDETDSNAPEVDYTFTVSVTDSCDDSIKNNPSIQFKLDDGDYGTWDGMVAAIKALAGDALGTKVYEAGSLPDAFTKDDDVHTISWKWAFEGDSTELDEDGMKAQDEADTAMGNADALAECSLSITIEAVQLNE